VETPPPLFQVELMVTSLRSTLPESLKRLGELEVALCNAAARW
jgi:hypothetical protein